MLNKIPTELVEELQDQMSIYRLRRVGFFQRLPVDSEIHRPELEMFRTILDRALIDFFSIREEIRVDVEEWLSLDNPDFIEISTNADLSPEFVYQAFYAVSVMLQAGKEIPEAVLETLKEE